MQENLVQKLEHVLGVKKYTSDMEKELFHKTQDFVRYIRWIPGLQMVAVSNSLAMYATHKESDIDLFIITEQKRLWIVRTTILIIATLLGVRTKAGNEAGRFCFPFFMTDKNLDLESVAIENDIYLAYWIRSLKPIYSKNNIYERFMKANERFYEVILGSEGIKNITENTNFLLKTDGDGLIEKIWSFLSPLLSLKDSFLGWISKKHITQKIPSNNSEGIAVNDDMVKIHPNDRRSEVRESVLRN